MSISGVEGEAEGKAEGEARLSQQTSSTTMSTVSEADTPGSEADSTSSTSTSTQASPNAVTAHKFGGDLADVITALVIFVGSVSVLVWFVVRADPNMMLTGILGALVGWGVGIVATPYNRSQANRLGDVSKVAYAALTGYVIAKFDRLFDALFVSNVVIFPYVGLGFAMFIGALIVTYITRSYRWTIKNPSA